MPASITKADGTRTPIGKLATYSIDKSNVPAIPTDNSGQIPTFSATITNATKDAKTHLGDPVVLTDINQQEAEGVVVSARQSANSGMLSLDMNTVFERLNTVQTTYPCYTDKSYNSNIASSAILQWLLLAGIPKFRMPGNLLHYVTNTDIGFSSRTDATWVLASFSEWIADHSRYRPNFGTDLGRLTVNKAQSVVMGMPINDWSQTVFNTEVILNTWVHTINSGVRFRLMQVGRVMSLQQSVSNAAWTTLSSLTVPVDATVSGDGFLYVRLKAHPTVAGNLEIVMKALGTKSDTGQIVVYSSTAASVATWLRNRPEIRSLDFGYDTTQAGLDVSPHLFFISEGDVLPDTLPKDQISIEFDPDAKPLTAIPGFTGNVWEKLKELCSLVELDILFTNDQIRFTPRKFQRSEQYSNTYIPMTTLGKSNLTEGASQREKARSVEVVYREQTDINLSAYYNTELWRADSVYSVEKGETKVEVIQTDNTFIALNQPVPVSGVPVPYTNSFGAYVITGHDGYIVDPQWWNDNGGSIKVQPTTKAGEFKLTIQAPNIDTERAPYRVSEGAADRPALYIFGHGLPLSEPKTVKIYTGDPDASEDVGTKYESILVTSKLAAFNAGHKIAVSYGSGDSDLTFSIPRKEKREFDTYGNYIYPGESTDHNVYHNGSAYRIEQFSITPATVNVSKCARFNTHRILNGEFATGKTIAQQNAMNAGKKIKDTNLAPLPTYLS
jgi:hypothetical protein